MNLFSSEINAFKNYLPYNGEVNYYGAIFLEEEATIIFKNLLQDIPWKNDEVVLFGKHIVTKRKMAWFANKPITYKYSGIARTAMVWNNLLYQIKHRVENITNEEFNSCLLNLYPTGDEGMGWHTDNENELLKNGSIASLSFGATRRFDFKHKKTKEKRSFQLKNGDLLVMKGETQKHWLHSIPKTKKVKTPRINLTFRQMILD